MTNSKFLSRKYTTKILKFKEHRPRTYVFCFEWITMGIQKEDLGYMAVHR